jgi:hypothetical protein
VPEAARDRVLGFEKGGCGNRRFPQMKSLLRLPILNAKKVACLRKLTAWLEKARQSASGERHETSYPLSSPYHSNSSIHAHSQFADYSDYFGHFPFFLAKPHVIFLL